MYLCAGFKKLAPIESANRFLMHAQNNLLYKNVINIEPVTV